MLRSLALMLLLAAPAAAGPAEDAAAAEKAGQLDEAARSWQRAIEAAPEDPAAYEALGRVLLRAQRFEEAAQTYAVLVQRIPGYARGRYQLAFALRKAGRHAEAAAQYRAYIEAAPQDPDARFGLAEALRQLGDGAGALEAYKAYVELENRPSEAKWVGRANDEIQRLEASAMVQPGPERPLEPPASAPVASAPVAEVPASAPLAELLPASGPATTDPDRAFRERQYAAAQSGYTAALSGQPDSAALHYRLAAAAGLAGDLATSETHAAHTARLDPDSPAGTDLALLARHQREQKAPPAAPDLARAELALREGRLRTAERLAARAAADSPPARARRSWIRGRALLGLGRGEEALVALKTAAGEGLIPPAMWLDLGEAAWHQGDHVAARRLFALAADALPERHPAGRRARARLAGDSGGSE